MKVYTDNAVPRHTVLNILNNDESLIDFTILLYVEIRVSMYNFRVQGVGRVIRIILNIVLFHSIFLN